ncbi:MAG TPA: M24 family metallopeptidase [Leptolyngbyaceae cyanobacterium M33_DOE_097]|uniref:M24 family metallopeptidase n=1 Tax=Oscillatoriales cyanobacterium SpSt-418 TaxID=2282169 RepID=A0A7C3KHY5_9CYAN|nr:M24 family metallopeptidase [Leptolyngbyaceae cyanobacterium M33_DOE_097]
MNVFDEVSYKLQLIRQALHEVGAAAVRLRGTDWFAWATAGGSNTVLLAAETGVAEVLITPTDAWILTDEIEAGRLQDEELPHCAEDPLYQLFVHPWSESFKRETFVKEVTSDGKILSDRPIQAEASLPQLLIQHRRVLLPSELDRYRQVGKLASEAMTEVMLQAQPGWTEYQLAGFGAHALWSRGLHPALTLVAGDRRLPLYRHPLPSGAVIGRQAMMVFCARGHGLYANLTRFVTFGSLSQTEKNLHQTVRYVEAAGLNACCFGVPLSQVYEAIAQAYDEQGYPNAIHEHHQGGTTGYLAREIVATSTTPNGLAANMAIAWNPSLPGAKVEDTFMLLEDKTLENLTLDSNWPSVEVDGRSRPLPLER